MHRKSARGFWRFTLIQHGNGSEWIAAVVREDSVADQQELAIPWSHRATADGCSGAQAIAKAAQVEAGQLAIYVYMWPAQSQLERHELAEPSKLLPLLDLCRSLAIQKSAPAQFYAGSGCMREYSAPHAHQFKPNMLACKGSGILSQISSIISSRNSSVICRSPDHNSTERMDSLQ